eukprot:6144675-Prymnesium_polylepis.1
MERAPPESECASCRGVAEALRLPAPWMKPICRETAARCASKKPAFAEASSLSSARADWRMT